MFATKMGKLDGKQTNHSYFCFTRHRLSNRPPDWKKFNACHLCSRLVHHISNRVIVGPKLCRNANYMEACTSYATTVFLSGIIWNFLPLGPFRSWFYWLGSFKHRMDLRRAANFLLPIFAERMAKQADAEIETKPVDAIQWMIDMPATSPKEIDARRHANRILHLTFAGTGTSISLVQHLIWQILIFPEYLPPLREEIDHCLAGYGGWGDEKALSHMNLLDSFIRETLRLNPPGVCKSVSSHIHTTSTDAKTRSWGSSNCNAKAIYFPRWPYSGARDADSFCYALSECGS